MSVLSSSAAQPSPPSAPSPPSPRIVRNSVRCRFCRAETESTDVHHFARCECGAVAVDGGHEYLKRVGDLGAEETSLVVDPQTGQTVPWVQWQAGIAASRRAVADVD